MKIESEIFYEQTWIQIEESDSETIPWKAWTGGKFLAGGMTRDKAIEATKMTIDNRLNPGTHKLRDRTLGNMNDELQKTLSQLAQKLGTTADHLWSVLVRQALVDSIVWFLTVAVMIGVTYALWVTFSKIKVNPKTDQGESLKVLSAILFGAMLILTFIILSTGLSSAIAGFFNPEYWALQDLMSKIHGD